MVQAALRANKVTIRDANLPPSADEFSEHFAGCAIASLVDCFSSYDQLPLAEKCRDMTGFMTSYGLLRHTRILQGATNSVAQFVRIMCHILRDLMPSVCMAYLDDVGVRGPSTTYDNAEDLPGSHCATRLRDCADALRFRAETGFSAGCRNPSLPAPSCLHIRIATPVATLGVAPTRSGRAGRSD